MRDTISVYARFLRARIVAKSESDKNAGKGRVAAIWRDALAWTLGIDVDMQERPKNIDLDELAISPAITLWRVDLAGDDGENGKNGAQPDAQPDAPAGKPGETGETWWLLEIPPRDHADGTRTELWSAFLSDAQFHELAECVDAMRGMTPQAPQALQAPQRVQNGGAA